MQFKPSNQKTTAEKDFLIVQIDQEKMWNISR